MKRRGSFARGGMIAAGGVGVAIIGGVALWRGSVRRRRCLEEQANSPNVPGLLPPCEYDPLKIAGAIAIPIGVIAALSGLAVGLAETS